MNEAARGGRSLDHAFGTLIGSLQRGPVGGFSGLWLLLIVLIGGFSLALPEQFPTVGTAQSMMFQIPELGLLSLAMAVPLISGGLNLAIIATANQSALVMLFVMKLGMSWGLPIWLVIVAGMIAGLILCIVIGLITGLLVVHTGAHPILVTLGTYSLIDGLSIFLTHGKTISGLPPSFQWIGNGTVLGVPASFLALLVLAFLVGVILKRTPFGISVFMIGTNAEATRFSGIDTRRVLIGVYVLSSILCFCASCIMLSRFNSVSADYAKSYLLITILAAVLGGIDPMGGFGRIAGLLLALIVLQVISSAFDLLGFSQQLTPAIWGITVIAVVALRRIMQSRAPIISPLPPAKEARAK